MDAWRKNHETDAQYLHTAAAGGTNWLDDRLFRRLDDPRWRWRWRRIQRCRGRSSRLGRNRNRKHRGGATATTSTSAGGTTTTSYTYCFDFPESTEGWQKNYASAFTLADKTVRDEAAAAALLGNSTADWMSGPGYGGANGFVQFSIPFATEQVEYQGLLYSYLPATGLSLSGKTIHAFVKLVSGMTADDPSKPLGAKLVIKSGPEYFYADGGWVNLSKNAWTELMLIVNKPTLDPNKDPLTYDPNDIREISVEFDTSGSATVVATPGILMLDRVCY